MFRVVNDYISKLHIGTDSEVYDKMSDFLTKDKKVESFNININYNRFFSFPYSSMYLRYNEGDMVRYRFVTCQENKTGVYMDVIISQK